MPTVQERMSCTARPSASSGWIEIGVLTGALKKMPPFSVTGTSPRTYFMSHDDSTPTAWWLPVWLKA